MLRLLTYNLHFGGGKDQNLWKRMMVDFSPDIVFAQETRHPQSYFEKPEFSAFKSCVHQNVPTHAQWGSGILSKRHELRQVSVTDDEYMGWAIGALASDLEVGGIHHEALLVSFHAPSLKSGSYEKHVGAMLAQIASKWSGIPIIIGGDFNLTTAYSRSGSVLGENTAGEVRVLRKLKDELGVINAWQHLYPAADLPQTLRWSKNKSIPYHCDAIFLNAGFAPNIVSAEVHSEGEWGVLSDHSPILVTLG